MIAFQHHEIIYQSRRPDRLVALERGWCCRAGVPGQLNGAKTQGDSAVERILPGQV
jgi:hypothetical protein